MGLSPLIRDLPGLQSLRTTVGDRQGAASQGMRYERHQDGTFKVALTVRC